jgi:hypothetical protein
MHVRQGGVVDKVVVREKHTIKCTTPLGTMYHSDFSGCAMIVAGHFAELKWGVARVPRVGDTFSGCDSDMQEIERLHRCIRDGKRVAKEDKIEARKTWQRSSRWLRALAKRDASLEHQVKSVAKGLSFQGKLTGEEVKTLMAVQP